MSIQGHSMGGQQVLHFGANGPADTLSQIRGIIAEAPFVRLSPATEPWQITVILGRLASKVLPYRQMINPVRADLLTHDPAANKKYSNDTLCHDTGTLEGLGGMLDRAAALDKGEVVPGKLVKSLWIGHGTADEIVRCDAAKQCFDRIAISDKTFVEYDGWYHVLHMERGEDKMKFRNDVIKWVLDRSGS
ncbi:MAG: hypothetical protein M1828_000940 [Chrysothrix sp. TS-e1954]|nr:MAG: hypothetical protein M1828_000940 [Chrysothrix sp. TS-e1954]